MKSRAILIKEWFKDHQRALPWREKYDPYEVWISEIMLQQTRITTVVPYFIRFMRTFPRLEDLAKAKESEVLKLWEGLGYYSRAKRLIPCAKKIYHEHQGQMPKNISDLLALPGIGPYTAGAIASIAFNEKYPAVDGNVKRVYARLTGDEFPVNHSKAHRHYEALVQKDLPAEPRDFNQGLMEIGALVCSPKNPTCQECPLQDTCHAYQHDLTATLPVYQRKSKVKSEDKVSLLLHYKGHFLMEERPENQLLGGLYGFPIFDSEEAAKGWLNRMKLVDMPYEIGQTKHVFTHRKWLIEVWKFDLDEMKKIAPYYWVHTDEFDKITIPKAFQKVLGTWKEDYEDESTR